MSEDWTREQIMELSAAFCRCRILLTAAELNLFTKLEPTARTVEELCQAEGWSPRGLTIVLDALAAMDLISKGEDGRYRTPPPLANVLTQRGDGSILPMLMHRVFLWNSWSNLTDIVRTGVNLYDATSPDRSDDEIEAFIGAMDVVAETVAESIVNSLDVKRYRHLLDLGGGPGTYSAVFLKKVPEMTATLFDFPKVVEIARKHLTKRGLMNRVKLVEGDFATDPLPGGNDLVWVSAIIHGNSRPENQELYRKIYAALDPGGAIFIRDFFMNDLRTSPIEGAIFAVNMLTATEDGNCYTFREVQEDLQAAGFRNVELIREGQRMDQIVYALK